MTTRRYSSIIALTLISNSAMAVTFQGEGVGSYNDWDGDKAYDLSLTAYFAPVSTAGHPLREAAFLERTSSANLSLTRLGEEPDELDLTSLNFSYYVPNTMFYVAGHYTHFDEAEDEFEPDHSDYKWGVTLGITPAEGLLLSTSYRTAPVYAGSLLGRLLGSGILIDRDSYETNLGAKYVVDLAGSTAANFEGGFVRSDYFDLLFLGADYYFDPTFSVGAWVEDYDSVGLTNGYGVRTEKFVTPKFSLQGSYFDFSDADIWQAAVRLRF